MKKLILMRHAKADRTAPVLDDHECPLSEAGRGTAPEMGQRLARNGVRPEAIICSDAARALETARLIAREIDFPEADIQPEPRLYNAGVGAWLEVIGGLNDRWTNVMCIGHNPGVSDLAAGVFGQPVTDLPTCAVLTLDFPAKFWNEIPSSLPAAAEYDHPKLKPPN